MKQPNNLSTVALEVQDLSLEVFSKFGYLTALNAVSFSVDKGEIFGLVGESGSGKSLTASAITGILEEVVQVVGGKILFFGEDLLSLGSQERRRLAGTEISIVFQDALAALNPVKTIGSQLGEAFSTHQQISKAELREKMIRLLERVGITEPAKRLNSYPHQFSGGMNQRILIAIAVALSPKILIADEPTTALDVTVQSQIMELLRELQREEQMTMMLITHDLSLLSQYADRIAVMYAGNIVEVGTTEQIFTSPKHPYTKGLVNSIPYGNYKQRVLETIPGSPPLLHEIPLGCVFQNRCPVVQDICKAIKPELKNLAGDRSSACHFSEDNDDQG